MRAEAVPCVWARLQAYISGCQHTIWDEFSLELLVGALKVHPVLNVPEELSNLGAPLWRFAPTPVTIEPEVLDRWKALNLSALLSPVL